MGKFLLGGVAIFAFYRGVEKMRIDMHVAYV